MVLGHLRCSFVNFLTLLFAPSTGAQTTGKGTYVQKVGHGLGRSHKSPGPTTSPGCHQGASSSPPDTPEPRTSVLLRHRVSRWGIMEPDPFSSQLPPLGSLLIVAL